MMGRGGGSNYSSSPLQFHGNSFAFWRHHFKKPVLCLFRHVQLSDSPAPCVDDVSKRNSSMSSPASMAGLRIILQVTWRGFRVSYQERPSKGAWTKGADSPVLQPPKGPEEGVKAFVAVGQDPNQCRQDCVKHQPLQPR